MRVSAKGFVRRSFFSQAATEDPLTQNRQQKKCEHRGTEQTSNHYCCQWPLDLCSCRSRHAMGINPKLATQAVISNGRSRRRAPARGSDASGISKNELKTKK